MAAAFDALRQMEYPGRIIILGKSPAGEEVVMYAITGRSPSSQARRLAIDEREKKVFVMPTDDATLKSGNPDLLVYAAMRYDRGIVVSNGKQTDDINTCMSSDAPAVSVLLEGLRSWEYEPDDPNFTPRISGCITARGAALSVLKRAQNGRPIKNYFDMPLIPGKGYLIATYTGRNENPLPSFSGEPQEVLITAAEPSACAETLYEALGPGSAGAPDYRVSAAAAFVDTNGAVSVRVKNRHAG